MGSEMCIRDRYKGRRVAILGDILEMGEISEYGHRLVGKSSMNNTDIICLLYTSDAADDSLRVDLCGRRILKKKNTA
ncbi:hypothetical protein CDFC105_84010 [Clostridioides difficile]|nr:hypothetical protein CDFC105_84010 [Clostridioides difficile]